MQYCDVILPLSLNRYFTYHIPEGFHKDIKQGKRVMVEFGNKKLYTAIVYKIHNSKPDQYKTKPLLDVIDTTSLVTQNQIRFWQWMAEYYMCSVGEIYKAALPAGLKLESETKISINELFVASQRLSKTEEDILTLLSKKKNITLNEIHLHLKGKTIYNPIKSLLDKKAIFTEEIIKEQYKPKLEKYISINPKFFDDTELNQLFDSLKRAKVQQNLVLAFMALSKKSMPENYIIKKNKLLEYSKAAPGALKSLIEKDIFREETKKVSRLENSNNTLPVKELTKVQSETLRKIENLYHTKNCVLLHGVTSSGKTEIYIHLIQKYLNQGKQVLYLLPEIALTTQIINRLRNVFGNKVGVYHSKFNDNERVEVYNGILNDSGKENSIQLVLGVRSSIFLPFHNLGLVIIDEEHENTYKQHDPAPRYHARDSAIYLATLFNAKVLLGTATPSIETYYNSKTGKYGLVEITERYQNIELPEVVIANTKEAYRKKQMKSLFAPQMLNSIETALNNKEQIILFKNRRGYAPYLECNTCNWIPYCKNCDVTLTYHKESNELSCHYCGFHRHIPSTCDVCGQPAMQTKGYGTEKIEDELSIFYPDAAIKRMDLDSTKSKKSYEKIISALENKEIDILVGTQMISKGLDFDNVSVVGILNADNMLNFPDFRAHERSYQLMAQVSGRAGRKNKRGKVIIQVSDAEHPVINDVVNNNYKGLFIKQLDERKLFRYPPFYKLIILKIKHKDKETVNKASYLLAQQLYKIFGNRVSGPEFPLIERVQNQYQKNILLKIETEKAGKKAKSIILNFIDQILALKDFKTVKIIIDVDPQ